MDQQTQEILDALAGADKVLIGIGNKWKLVGDGRDIKERRLGNPGQTRLKEAHDRLCELVKDRDYYVVTAVTDGAIYDTGFDSGWVMAPCGNTHWRQCSAACIKDIWEGGEVPGDVCPHCGAPLTGSTLEAGRYIGEGYLLRWEVYKRWQTGTLNRNPMILELGEGFKTPTVIKQPFEETAFFNQKTRFFRIHESLYQVLGEMGEKALGIGCNSVDFILKWQQFGTSGVKWV